MSLHPCIRPKAPSRAFAGLKRSCTVPSEMNDLKNIQRPARSFVFLAWIPFHLFEFDVPPQVGNGLQMPGWISGSGALMKDDSFLRVTGHDLPLHAGEIYMTAASCTAEVPRRTRPGRPDIC